MTTYNIPVTNISRFEKIVEGLARRAVRLGQAEPTAVITGEHFENYLDPDTKETFVVKIYAVEVNGTSPIIEGWQFVAVLDHSHEAGNIVNAIPGYEIPEKFRNTGAICEHCNQERRRNDTFVVMHVESGEYKQVGSSCIKDFTGHVDPHAAAKYAEALALASSSLDDCEDFDFNGNRGPAYYNATRFLAYAVKTTEKYGYTSRGNSGYGKAATADIVASDFFAKDKANDDYPTDAHVKLAEKVWAWAKEFFAQDENKKSDFGFSYFVLTSSEQNVTYRDFGRLVFLPEAYKRWQEEQARSQASTSRHVGKIGDKITFTGVVLAAKIASSNYQFTSYLNKFQDADGNVYVWFGSKEPTWGAGDTVTVNGTVKDHSEYKGEKNTLITRCKVVVTKKA